MTDPRLFDAPPTTLCGYCARPLTPHPTVAGAFACRSAGYTEGLAWFAAFVREAHRDRVGR